MSYGRLGGSLGYTLRDVRKRCAKIKPRSGYHFYAVGIKWKDKKRPEWFKNPIEAKNKKEAIKILVTQYSLPADMLVLRRIK